MTDGVNKPKNHFDPDMGHLINRARREEDPVSGVMPKKPEPERLMFGDPAFTARFQAMSGSLDAAIAKQPAHIQANIAELRAEREAAAAQAPDDYPGADSADRDLVRGEVRKGHQGHAATRGTGFDTTPSS